MIEKKSMIQNRILKQLDSREVQLLLQTMLSQLQRVMIPVKLIANKLITSYEKLGDILIFVTK